MEGSIQLPAISHQKERNALLVERYAPGERYQAFLKAEADRCSRRSKSSLRGGGRAGRTHLGVSLAGGRR